MAFLGGGPRPVPLFWLFAPREEPEIGQVHRRSGASESRSAATAAVFRHESFLQAGSPAAVRSWRRCPRTTKKKQQQKCDRASRPRQVRRNYTISTTGARRLTPARLAGSENADAFARKTSVRHDTLTPNDLQASGARPVHDPPKLRPRTLFFRILISAISLSVSRNPIYGLWGLSRGT